MFNLLSQFWDYLTGLNLVNMVIGMIISWALADFTKELINQLMKPITEKIGTVGSEDRKLVVLGAEIQLGVLLNKLFLVVMNLFFAFLLFISFGGNQQ